MTLFPLVEGLVASVLFFIQGGFGGGHGKFDSLIVILGLPTVLMTEAAPLPRFIVGRDILFIVWLPALMNALLFFLVAQIIGGWRSTK